MHKRDLHYYRSWSYGEDHAEARGCWDNPNKALIVKARDPFSDTLKVQRTVTQRLLSASRLRLTRVHAPQLPKSNNHATLSIR